MDIEINEITSEVHTMDDVALDPKIKRMLMQEIMVHLRESEDHAHRVRKERGINANRTTEEIG
jgi:hypothetical protein